MNEEKRLQRRQRLMDNKRNFQIICSRAELTDELVPAYLEICDCLKKLVTLNVRQPRGYMIATHSIALDILYRLIADFSIPIEVNEAHIARVR